MKAITLVIMLGILFMSTGVNADSLSGGAYSIDAASVNTVSGTLQGNNYSLQADSLTASGTLSGGGYTMSTGGYSGTTSTTPVTPVVPGGGGGGGGGSASVILSLQTLRTSMSSPELQGLYNTSLFNPADISLSIEGKTYSITAATTGVWKLSAGIITPALSNGVHDVVVTGKRRGGAKDYVVKSTLTVLGSPQLVSAISCKANFKVLQKGQTGVRVRSLQAYLDSLGYWKGVHTNKYDQSTIDAVARFQRYYKIPTNSRNLGLFGPATASKANQVCRELMSKTKNSTAPTKLPLVQTTKKKPALSCPVFTREMRFGAVGTKVKRLQEFLRAELGDTSIKVNGLYAFDTGSAVQRFQEKYFDEIVRAGGLTKSTGRFGSFSMKKANSILGCQ